MVQVVFFRERTGVTPFLEWFHGLPAPAQGNCRARLEQLAGQGHMLRRPAGDFLRQGIYELRSRAGRVRYRMLYFFHSGTVVVISHGFIKVEAAVPAIEIERALHRKHLFSLNPILHTSVLGDLP